jgi:plastocyanin
MHLRGLTVMASAALLVGIFSGCVQTGAAAPSPVAVSSVDLPPSYRFVPADISVRTGTTVTWTNNDHFSHSVQFLDGGLPSEPLAMGPGHAVTFKFDRPGLYRYQCHLHPQNMKGSVKVTP